MRKSSMGRLTVATFNLEEGCIRYGADKAAAVISHGNADIVLLQEIGEDEFVVSRIASLLGFYVIIFSEFKTAILSKIPMTKLTNDGLAKIGAEYYVYVIHLPDYPYIAFEAAGMPYYSDFTSTDERELQNRSLEHRLPHIERIRNTLRNYVPPNATVILGGDLNEPSHRDWTDATVTAGHAPITLQFPITTILEHWGFHDSYRDAHASSVIHRGVTWPDRKLSHEEQPYRADRIDFIFSRNLRGSVEESVVIKSHVSDHSMVKTTYSSFTD